MPFVSVKNLHLWDGELFIVETWQGDTNQDLMVFLDSNWVVVSDIVGGGPLLTLSKTKAIDESLEEIGQNFTWTAVGLNSYDLEDVVQRVYARTIQDAIILKMFL